MVVSNRLMNKEKLKNKSVKELESLFENLVTRNDSDFTSVIKALISKHNGKDSKRFKELETELLISNIRKNNTTNDRFTALKSSEIKAHLSAEKINYIKNRILNTANSILKAKYSDIIYELDKKQVEFAKMAINAYIESSKNYLINKFELKFVDAIERALSLALLIKDNLLTQKAYQAHISSINILYKNKPFLGFIGVIESITERVKKLKNITPDFDLFENLIEKIILKEQVPDQSTYNLHRRLLYLLLTFPSIKKDNLKSKSIRARIADAFILEGNHVGATRSQMIAAKFYEDALKILISIGSNQSTVENLQKKIRIANQEALTKEYKKIPFELSIPTKVIEDYLAIYENKKEQEIYDLVSYEDGLMPDYNRLVNLITSKTHPIMFFHQSAMRGSLKVKNITTIEGKIAQEVLTQMMLQIEFLSIVILDKIFNLLKKQYPKYSTNLIQRITSSSLIADNRKALITHGIERYKAEDYISSMHILVFQIEGILRDTLYKFDGATFNYRNKEMRELTLGTIIRKLVEKKIFSLNFLKYIEVNLCEIRTKNIRNDIAHGNQNLNLFSRFNNQILLFILLKITGYKLSLKSKE